MGKNKTRLAIFDLDGTLLNTIEDLGTACNHALEMCGCQKRRMEEYNKLVGRGIYNLFRGALPEGMKSDAMVMKMKGFFVPYYNMHKCDLTRPYEGIPEMLLRLKEKGILLAVASNKYQEGTEQLIRHYFGEGMFAAVLGQREGMPIKPDPRIIYEIMDAAGIHAKDEAIYAGDSDVDMETGRNAGIRTAGVTWGFRSREELAEYNPWKVCENPEALLKAILGE